MQTGTLVQWFNLLDAAGLRAAELCLVLRYSSGEQRVRPFYPLDTSACLDLVASINEGLVKGGWLTETGMGGSREERHAMQHGHWEWEGKRPGKERQNFGGQRGPVLVLLMFLSRLHTPW